MKKLLMASLISIMATSPLLAETTPSITVETTRTKEKIEKLPDTVEIITKEEIEKYNIKTIEDVIKYTTGITVSDNGWGQIPDIYIHGLKSKYILVMINGIPITDPTSIENTPLFSLIDVSSASKIEILKGSQSAAYGSQAVAGIINVIIKPEKENSFLFEGGKYSTFKEKISLFQSNKISYLNVSFENFKTNGYDITGNGDKDGSSYKALTFNFSLRPTKLTKINTLLIAKNGKDEYDEGEVNYENLFSSINFKKIVSENTLITTKTAFIKNQRDYGFSTYNGTSFYFSFYPTTVIKNLTTSYGISYQRLSGETSSFDKSYDTKSAFINNSISFKRVSFRLDGRVDRHSDFGNFFSYKIGTSVELLKNSSYLKLETGRGFKAPSLEQLYCYYPSMFGWPATYGNPNLEPEKSRSYTVGLIKKLNKEDFIEVNYFKNKIDDIIVWTMIDTVNATYENLNKATTEGVETSVKIKIAPTTDLKLGYTYTKATWSDGSNTYTLPKVPKNSFNLTLNTKISNIEITTTGLYYGERFDDTYNTKKLSPFTLWNLYINYKISKKLSLNLKILNVTNEKYFLSDGYREPDRMVFGSVKYVF